MKIVICILLLFNFSGLSRTHECFGYTRNLKDKLDLSRVTIPLISNEGYQGKFFEIIEGVNHQSVVFNSKISNRACHVYFHLLKAKKYFEDQLGITISKQKLPIKVRIEMDQGFDDSVHFMPKRFGTVANNAITIPPSTNMRLDEVKAWNHEIWFAPKKVIKLNSGLEQGANNLASSQMMKGLLLGVGEKELTLIAQDIAQGGKIDKFSRDYYLYSLLMSVGVTALVPNLAKWGSKISKKKVFLDSALIPEVVYHEFAHLALSDIIDIGHSSPLGESIANYFASKVSGRDNILKNSKPFSKGLVAIEANKIKKYRYFYDDSKYSQADFGFKFLHALNSKLGKDFDLILIQSLKHLDQSKKLTLKNNLVPALHYTIYKRQSALEQMKFLNVLQEVGI